jgi:N-hydroxyarylamine O-acetyltransferase
LGGAYVPPLPLVDGAEATSPDGARHRLRRLGGGLAGDWLLERAGPPETTDGRTLAHEDWQAQYSFELAEVGPDDLEQSNHWTSTRPGVRFTTTHLASIVLDDGFAALTDRRLKVARNGTSVVRELDDPAEWRRALADTFAIELDAEEVAALPLWSA